MMDSMVGKEVRFVTIGLEVKRGILEMVEEHVFKVSGVIYPVQNLVTMQTTEQDEFVILRHDEELKKRMVKRHEKRGRKRMMMA